MSKERIFGKVRIYNKDSFKYSQIRECRCVFTQNQIQNGRFGVFVQQLF